MPWLTSHAWFEKGLNSTALMHEHWKSFSLVPVFHFSLSHLHHQQLFWCHGHWLQLAQTMCHCLAHRLFARFCASCTCLPGGVFPPATADPAPWHVPRMLPPWALTPCRLPSFAPFPAPICLLPSMVTKNLKLRFLDSSLQMMQIWSLDLNLLLLTVPYRNKWLFGFLKN